jgi:hypothetical protein
MSASKQDKPLGGEELADSLKAQGVKPSAQSASGLAAAGSPPGVDTAGKGGEGASEVGTDTILKPGKNHGGQIEPAQFVVNGSVPYDYVPSPSGPVPASVITDDAKRTATVEAARQAARNATKNSLRFLTESDLQSMSPAEVRAVAWDRGYEMKDGGRAAVRRAFAAAQDDDESIEESPKGRSKKQRDAELAFGTTPTIPNVPNTAMAGFASMPGGHAQGAVTEKPGQGSVAPQKDKK